MLIWIKYRSLGYDRKIALKILLRIWLKKLRLDMKKRVSISIISNSKLINSFSKTESIHRNFNSSRSLWNRRNIPHLKFKMAYLNRNKFSKENSQPSCQLVLSWVKIIMVTYQILTCNKKINQLLTSWHPMILSMMITNLKLKKLSTQIWKEPK